MKSNLVWMLAMISAWLILPGFTGCGGDKGPVAPKEFAPPPAPGDEKGETEKG